MTLEEIKFAIDFFEENMPVWDYEANVYCAETCYGLGEFICTEPEGYIFRTAIEALEKQIPKKPLLKAQRYRCECGALVGMNHKYCSQCSQAIDWSEVTK